MTDQDVTFDGYTHSDPGTTEHTHVEEVMGVWIQVSVQGLPKRRISPHGEDTDKVQQVVDQFN